MRNRGSIEDLQILSLKKNSDDINKIGNFYKTVGGNHLLDSQVLHYEYLDNPDRYSDLYYAIDKESLLMGSVGLIGFDLIKGGNKVRTFMLDRVLLHRSYWGSDLFKHLEAQWESTKEESTDIDVSMIWGLTSVPKSFENVGYQIHSCLIRLSLEISDSASLIKKSKSRLTLESGYSSDLTDFVYSMSHKYPDYYFMNYDQEKVNWLIIKNPFEKREIIRFYFENVLIGFCVFRKRKETVLILDDLVIPNMDYLPEIIQEIANQAVSHNCSRISFYLNESNELMKKISTLLLSLGFNKTDHIAKLTMKIPKGKLSAPEQLYVGGMWAPPFWAAL